MITKSPTFADVSRYECIQKKHSCPKHQNTIIYLLQITSEENPVSIYDETLSLEMQFNENANQQEFLTQIGRIKLIWQCNERFSLLLSELTNTDFEGRNPNTVKNVDLQTINHLFQSIYKSPKLFELAKVQFLNKLSLEDSCYRENIAKV